MNTSRKLLLFGYGNPSRGDDALGPSLVARIELLKLGHIECQNDMQLQVEHIMDFIERDQIMFIDADLSCTEPFVFSKVAAAKDNSYTTHAMTPHTVLHIYQEVYRQKPPPAYLLRIRGYHFALCEELSAKARINLEEAIKLVSKLCHIGSFEIKCKA
ncbi:MAG TPA: Ni/Fe hydrogenase [Nitrosomonas nitrosa]|jgi:hydrogenase maturation protease|uniref:Hydrogenase maturation protease n=1 Tax=Nitrosomonas nitrosa TaxID=52442 RepID=A0A1I4Q953_9PROT|nr:hydrogenase maturation protease [Nitrosomonas nitrosa]CAE6500872.1 Hydrogenase maturation protease [Nitrosomonas nitrosa]SFM36130.1 hydrogenase maturation protease [Nitrosomonas nitrosa]HBZ30018.1 Ni/Fe hydrogenase [Nitrosomonas nitrosa]